MNFLVNVSPDLSKYGVTKSHSPTRTPYSFQSLPKPSWERPKYRPPPAPEDNMTYGNIMYDRRVVRGPTYLHHPVPTQTAESQAARQAEARRRSMARRKAQNQRARTLRYRLGTPPPVEGRKHQNMQTQEYLEELFDNPPEVNVYTQTDFFLVRPPTPEFEQVSTGVEVATQVFPGELFHFDTEVRPVLEVLVGKTIEQSLMEVFEEDETAAIREKHKTLREARDAEIEEEQRLQAAEDRRRKQVEERIFEEEEAALDQKETESRVAAAVLTTGYIADLLPSVMQGLKDAGYLYEEVDDDMEGEFMDWIIKEVKTEMQRMVENRDLLSEMLRDILSSRAELYKSLGEKAAAKRGADDEDELTASESQITEQHEESLGAEAEEMASVHEEQTEVENISLRVDCDSGLLVSDDDVRLVQCLPLAADFHSCSLFLERSPGRQDTVFLQTAKPLKPGDPLHLWFSTDLQALLGISFLSPRNIRGEKNYVCHFCEESFEYPNPLKVHLALDCGKMKPSQLWRRLKEAIDLTNNNFRSVIPYDSILKLSLEPETKIVDHSDLDDTPPSPAHSSYSNPSPNRERLEEVRPSSEPPRNSAFRPYLSLPLRDALYHKRGNYSLSSSDGEDNQNLRVNLNREVYLQHQAAEIETLVSNLGQSKQGHLCLYCGKIYSRKYGLKIHIRTHTGFKPLKCKYCLRPFGDPSNLNKHVRLHAESETPYRCEICGKMLVRRRDLERHIKSRHKLSYMSY